MRILILLALSITAISCVSTYQIRKSDLDPENNSSLVIHRKGPLNFLSSVKVYIDDQFVGQLGPGRYLNIAIHPGKHIIKAKGLSNTAYYSVVVKENTTYTVSLKHKMKLTNQVDINVDPTANTDISKIKKPELKVLD